MRLLKNALFLFLFLLIFWILLTGLDIQELVAGIIISLLISLLMAKRILIFSEIRLSPKAFAYGIAYLLVFALELVKSNLDVAYRVIDPKLPINPGIVKVRTNLRSKLGRIILANSITLTPGTLTVETKEDFFYIHWIDVTAEDIDRSTDQIVKKFEKYLEVIFG